MIESILEYLAGNPPGAWAGPLLGVVAFVETLFPPIPGDILFIVLSGWAVAGGFPLILAGIYGVTGCFLASCLLFWLGHRHGRKFVDSLLKRKVEPARINRAKELIAGHGPVILAASRFIPGVRSLLVLMAGSSGMRFVLAAVPVAFSALAWYAILSIAGSVFGKSIPAAEGFMKRFEIWIWIFLAFAVLTLIVVKICRRRGKG